MNFATVKKYVMANAWAGYAAVFIAGVVAGAILF